MTRYLPDILARMLALIPADPRHIDLRIELEHLQNSAMFTAPEAMRHRWLEGMYILKRHIPLPPQLADWQIEMMRIWRNEQTAKEGVSQ